jgi:hypothetical protein
MALNTRQILDGNFNLDDNYTVVVNENGMRAPTMCTADVSFFTRNPVTKSIRIPSGYFWQRLAGGLCRVLPITKVVMATVTTSPIVKVHCAGIFKVGEVLQNQANNAVLGTIQSIDPEKNEITLEANAAIVLTAGAFIHVAGTTIAKPTTPTGPGVLGCNLSILDLNEFDDVAMHIGATVWAVRMPQPAAVHALFPLISAV